jgi:hypothetical protein
VGTELFHADGETDGHEANGRFSQFCEKRLKTEVLFFFNIKIFFHFQSKRYNLFLQILWIRGPILCREEILSAVRTLRRFWLLYQKL